MAEITVEKLVVTNSEGDKFPLENVVVGVVDSVTHGAKGVKIVIKEIGGNREKILDLTRLVGQEILIPALEAVMVNKEEVEAEPTDNGQLLLKL